MSKHLFADLLLIIIIIVIGVAVFFTVRNDNNIGEYVLVIIDGEQSARYPLDEDTVQLIERGEYRNTLVIKDGEAFVSEANCPDGRCSRHHPIKYDGETVICLPHKLVIEIEK